jgi:hypothetical protein
MLHDSVEEVAAEKVAHHRYRGNAPVLVLCDATRAFDNENPSFNDFTASAAHDDGPNVVLDDWC